MLYDPCWNDPILEGLGQVDKLISDEDHWFIGSLGRTKPRPYPLDNRVHGRRCPITASPTAEVNAYLLRGVKRVAPEVSSVPEFNNHDDRTFEEVKHMIQVAKDIRREEILAEVLV